jgi:hypothetical protein
MAELDRRATPALARLSAQSRRRLLRAGAVAAGAAAYMAPSMRSAQSALACHVGGNCTVAPAGGGKTFLRITSTGGSYVSEWELSFVNQAPKYCVYEITRIIDTALTFTGAGGVTMLSPQRYYCNSTFTTLFGTWTPGSPGVWTPANALPLVEPGQIVRAYARIEFTGTAGSSGILNNLADIHYRWDGSDLVHNVAGGSSTIQLP